jgi:hypothetical protein
MRASDDGSIESDTRVRPWLKWCFRQRWIPDVMLRLLWPFGIKL